jgi:hypothetical protein
VFFTPQVVVFTELFDLLSLVQRLARTICFKLTSKEGAAGLSQWRFARVWQSSRLLHWLTTRGAAASLLTIRRLQALAVSLKRRFCR